MVRQPFFFAPIFTKTCDVGLCFKSYLDRGFKCFYDANFLGLWTRSGGETKFAGCYCTWLQSYLQLGDGTNLFHLLLNIPWFIAPDSVTRKWALGIISLVVNKTVKYRTDSMMWKSMYWATLTFWELCVRASYIGSQGLTDLEVNVPQDMYAFAILEIDYPILVRIVEEVGRN